MSGATKTDSAGDLSKYIPELQDMPRRDIANKLNEPLSFKLYTYLTLIQYTYL